MLTTHHIDLAILHCCISNTCITKILDFKLEFFKATRKKLKLFVIVEQLAVVALFPHHSNVQEGSVKCNLLAIHSIFGVLIIEHTICGSLDSFFTTHFSHILTQWLYFKWGFSQLYLSSGLVHSKATHFKSNNMKIAHWD